MDEGVLKRALEREKSRRSKAEAQLEDKSRELYTSYEALQELNKNLETALTEVNSKQHQLIQSEKMASLGIMSTGIAHEINNPLAYVYSNINSLNDAVEQFSVYHKHVNNLLSAEKITDRDAYRKKLSVFSQEEDLEYLFNDCVELIKETKDGIERVKTIVSNLQTFARKETGNMELLDLHDCLTKTIKLADNQIKLSADLETDFSDIPSISGFPGKLSQVFLNLIVNAVHAMGENRGKIKIATAVSENIVMVKVTDTGCGMDAETMDNIFLPFFTTKDVGKGTGLGLSISHGIIEEHQGTIAVESVLGEGTTFTLEFPVPPATAKAA